MVPKILQHILLINHYLTAYAFMESTIKQVVDIAQKKFIHQELQKIVHLIKTAIVLMVRWELIDVSANIIQKE